MTDDVPTTVSGGSAAPVERHVDLGEPSLAECVYQMENWLREAEFAKRYYERCMAKLVEWAAKCPIGNGEPT